MTDIELRLRTSDVQIDSRGTLFPRVNCKPSPTAICGNSTLTLDDCGISNQDLFQLVDDGSFGGQVDLDWTPNPGVGLSDAILTVEDDLGQSASCKTTLDITAPLCVRPSDGSVVERVLATSVDGDSTAIGVLFDVQSADETILMKGLDLNINTADVVAVEVWGREGSYIEWDDGNWELLMTANVSGRGPQNLTPLGFFAEPVVIDPNTTRGFYATLTGVDSAILYSDAGTISQWRSGNSDLRVVNSAPVDIYPLNQSYTESFWNQSIPNIALRYTAGMASVFVTISHDFWPSETGWRLQRVVGMTLMILSLFLTCRHPQLLPMQITLGRCCCFLEPIHCNCSIYSVMASQMVDTSFRTNQRPGMLFSMIAISHRKARHSRRRANLCGSTLRMISQ